MRIAAAAFIQDPLTLDVVVNAPALTHQGIVIARDRLRHLSSKRRQPAKVQNQALSTAGDGRIGAGLSSGSPYI
jgi:hypothetical protein